MHQTELFPEGDVIDHRCEILYNYLRQNWIINRVTPIFNIDKILYCSKIYKVNCETVLKESERLLNSYVYGDDSENT
jgi:hypothetical protein